MERTVIWFVVVVAVYAQVHSESFTPIQYNDAQLNYYVPPPPPTIPVQRFEANRAMPMSSSSSIWSQELLNALQRNAPQPSPQPSPPNFQPPSSSDLNSPVPLQPQNLQPQSSSSPAPPQFQRAKSTRIQEIRQEQSIMYQQNPQQKSGQMDQSFFSSQMPRMAHCFPYPSCLRASLKICSIIYYANSNHALTRLPNNQLKFLNTISPNKNTQLFTLEQQHFQSTWRISIAGQYLTDINNPGWWWSTSVIQLTATPTWHSNWYLQETSSGPGFLTHVQNVANVFSYWRICPWNIGFPHNNLCSRVLKHSHRFRFVQYPCQKKYKWNW